MTVATSRRNRAQAWLDIATFPADNVPYEFKRPRNRPVERDGDG